VVYAGVDPLTGQRRYLKESAETYEGAIVALTKMQNQVDRSRAFAGMSVSGRL
jgi:hypothetical protein